MKKGFLDDWITSLETLIQGLEAAKDAAAPELRAALDEWVQATEEDARQILGRPSWLLTRSITSKVKDYQQGRKIWAMAGFRFRSKEPRDPGMYGRFHEAGWAPVGHKVTAPDHFLRQAKAKNLMQLDKRCRAALQNVMALVSEISKQRRWAEKAKKLR